MQKRVLTNFHDFVERALVGGGAVPAAVGELSLALLDGHARAVRYFAHDLGFFLADLALLAPDATRLPADAVWVHHQGASDGPVCANARINHETNVPRTCSL